MTDIIDKDRQEIMDLLFNYSYFYDEGDIDLFTDLFVNDAVLNIYLHGQQQPIAQIISKKDIHEFVVGRRTMIAEKVIQTRHFLSNTILKQISKDQINGTSMLYFVRTEIGDNVPMMAGTGIYKDEFKLTDQGWRFGSRNLYFDSDSIAFLSIGEMI